MPLIYLYVYTYFKRVLLIFLYLYDRKQLSLDKARSLNKHRHMLANCWDFVSDEWQKPIAEPRPSCMVFRPTLSE